MNRPATTHDLAARLHVSAETIRAACAGGRIAGAYRVGRQWLIPAESADEFAASYRPYQRS